MRLSIVRVVVMAFAVLATPGSSFGGPQKGKDGRRAAAKEDESEKPPFVGMTKAQALNRYGEPKKHTVTDEGEQWFYILNMGEAIGKAFIPFNFKPTPIRTGTLTFGADGKVKKFAWDKETNG